MNCGVRWFAPQYQTGQQKTGIANATTTLSFLAVLQANALCGAGVIQFILEHLAKDIAALLAVTDVLIDGPFLLEQRDISLAFRGSGNQRLLDVPASLRTGKAVEWSDPARGAW